MQFISVHIPKTAGTSLAYAFDHGTDRAVLFDYRADCTNVDFTEREREDFLSARDFVISKFKFIHGHFYLKKYASLLPQAKVITCFRHPVDRIISQYRHTWYEQNSETIAFKRIQDGMDVVDFSKYKSIGHAHLNHLGRIDPSELDFIFLSHALEEGLSLFQKKFPKVIFNNWATSPRLNLADAREVGFKGDKLEITQAQREEISLIIPDEMEYYRLAEVEYMEKKKVIISNDFA